MAGTDFYEYYTGIKLPLPKLDMVAIPGKRGAVEHWGLLQFDEERMLVNQVWDLIMLHFQYPLRVLVSTIAWRRVWQEMELQLRNESSTSHRL